jgi:hypothetical protein
MNFDAPLPLGERILGSTSPLRLDTLQRLVQRWFSPQALLSVRPTVVEESFKVGLDWDYSQNTARQAQYNLLPTSRFGSRTFK